MADEADMSDGRIQQMIDDGIARARRTKVKSLIAIGVCHWCESPVAPGRLFCDKDCLDDHTHDSERRRINNT